MTITNLNSRRAITIALYAAIIVLIPVATAIAVGAAGRDLGDATREVFWNIVSWARWVVYAAAAVVLLAVAYGPYKRSRLWMLGKPEKRWDRIPERLKAFLLYGIGQGRMPNDLYAATMHLLIFWGWVALFIGTVLLAIHDDFFHFLEGSVYLGYSLTLDLFGVVALTGLGMAIYRRYVWHHPKMRLGSLWDDGFLLWLMTVIVVTGFLIEGMRMGVSELRPAIIEGDIATNPDWAPWSPIGWLIAKAFVGLGASNGLMEGIHKAIWWSHFPMAMLWIAWVGYGKISHIFLGSANIFTRKLSNTGARLAGSTLDPITDFETAESFGAGKLQDFTWKHLADTEICVRCGRCEANCPAWLTGKDLTPMGFLKDMKDYMKAHGPILVAAVKNGEEPFEDERLIAGDVVSENVIWDCVTCGACENQCPIFIEHIQKLQDMRRYLVLTEAKMPETAQMTLMNLEQRGHPWRGTQLTRTTWIEELAAEGTEVPMFDGSQEYLYWVGCTGALQERNVKVTKALTRLLIEGGVSFGVLGAEEGCTGDPARRMGNEYLFQTQAQENIENFKTKGVKKIISNCPHCFNTMKNEYPQFGGEFSLVHHTQLLTDLITQGKLRPESGNGVSEMTFTYHDPCYLARHNGETDAPRDILNATGATISEMARNRRNTFCCGAGGGHMWIEESKGKRINHVRTEEAEATGAQAVAVGCPFCMQMFEEGTGSVPAAAEREMKVYDVAELLEMSIHSGKRAAKAATDKSEA